MTLKRHVFLVCAGLCCMQCHGRPTRRAQASHLNLAKQLGDDDVYEPTDVPTEAPTAYLTDARADADATTDIISFSDSVNKEATLPFAIEDDVDIDVEFENKKSKLPLNMLMGSPVETEHAIEIHYEAPKHANSRDHNGALINENDQHQHNRVQHTAKALSDVHRASTYHRVKDVALKNIAPKDVGHRPIPVSSTSESSSDANELKYRKENKQYQDRMNNYDRHHDDSNIYHSSRANRGQYEQNQDYSRGDSTIHQPSRPNRGQYNPNQNYYSGRNNGDSTFHQPSRGQYDQNKDYYSGRNRGDSTIHQPNRGQYNPSQDYYTGRSNGYSRPNGGQYDRSKDYYSRNRNYVSTIHQPSHPYRGKPNYGNAYDNNSYYIPQHHVYAEHSNVQQYNPLPFNTNRLTNILPQASLLNNGFSIVQASPSRFHVGYPRSFAQAFTRLN